MRATVFISVGFAQFGCSTKHVMEDNAPRFKDINEEYEKVVKVDAIPVNPPPEAPAEIKVKTKKKKTKKLKAEPKVETKVEDVINGKRQPEIEDAEGFVGRRPVVDPFRENEKVVLSVNYFNVVAGDLAIEVQPSKMVNEKKAYHFSMNVKTSKMFSLFYAVDDTAETYVDYDSLAPMTYTLEGRESAQRKEVRCFFDWQKREATFWEKVIKKDDGEKKRKVVWAIDPFTQNVISALYYLRTFQLTPKKQLQFRVSDDGKNYIFHGDVLRREKLQTDIGEFNTVVVQPTFQLEGQFKPTGDIFMWFTDDDRKLPVRIEAKIKIGTLVAKLKSIQKGNSP
jgi:Protein of unknown function (DUF3108)